MSLYKCLSALHCMCEPGSTCTSADFATLILIDFIHLAFSLQQWRPVQQSTTTFWILSRQSSTVLIISLLQARCDPLVCSPACRSLFLCSCLVSHSAFRRCEL